MIKVLIVDDSEFMRKVLTDLFAAEQDFKVIDTARNGLEAIDKVKRLKPDLVTMDVEMPVLDGLKSLEQIMRESPVPVLMISSLTRAGAEATLRALTLGAVDFVAKTAGPISSIVDVQPEIIAKARSAVRANVRQLIKPLQERQQEKKLFTAPVSSPVGSGQIVAIGTSTGGPRALQEVLIRLPGDLPCGVVIVQHMPAGFTKSLAERLNTVSELTVKEAEHNDVVRPGNVYIAPGSYHMVLEMEGGKTVIKLNQDPPIGGLRPAVDPMMESVAKIYGSQAIGVILTGMGHDGSKGMQAIKRQHGNTIAEDMTTAVVYGMPKSAIELNVVDRIVPLPEVAGEIIRHIKK